jgi:hypothetical protein
MIQIGNTRNNVWIGLSVPPSQSGGDPPNLVSAIHTAKFAA